MPRISFDFKNKKNNWINKCLLVRVLVLKHFELNSQMCRHCRLIALINLSPLEFRWMARTCRYRASRFLLAHNWNFCFFLYRDSCDSSEINCKPFFRFLSQMCLAADIVIEIPGNLGQEDSSYRLDYYPPFGDPAPNTTIPSQEIGDEIQFSNVLAGTKYNFWLYYTNATHHNLLAWTVSITTGTKLISHRILAENSPLEGRI